ncbi:MAG: T9SS type A sorting domain-containing protein [Saprospiraceae bacterium]
MQLSPNPVREQLFIESTAHTIKYVEIFDVQGRLIKQVVGVNASQAQLSLQGLKPQILVVRLRAGDQMVVRQIVKQ